MNKMNLDQQLEIKKDNKSLDEIFLTAADAGAEDVEDQGDEITIYTKPQDLAKVRQALENEKLSIVSAELVRRPGTVVVVNNPDSVKKVLSFMEKLEAHDDVQKVYANFDIPEELLS